MPGVDARRDKLGAGGSHIGEKRLAILVDERNVAEVNDGTLAPFDQAAVVPASAEFRNPQTRQLPA